MTQDILFQHLVQVIRHSSKKNEKRAVLLHGRVMNIKSSTARLAENHLINELTRIKNTFNIKTITEDINLKMIFLFPQSVFFTKKGERSKKLPDLSNLYELPQDVMQTVGIIENDTQVCGHDGSGRSYNTQPTDESFSLFIQITKVS